MQQYGTQVVPAAFRSFTHMQSCRTGETTESRKKQTEIGLEMLGRKTGLDEKPRRNSREEREPVLGSRQSDNIGD